MGDIGGDNVEFYRDLLTKLQNEGSLDSGGVGYNPYDELTLKGKILALIKDKKIVK